MSILQLRIAYMIIDQSDYFYVALLCCRQAEEAQKKLSELQELVTLLQGMVRVSWLDP